MAKKEKSLMRQLIEERGIKDMDGVHALVKELTAGLIQECMDAELEEELGYSRYDYKNKRTDNSRNGSYRTYRRSRRRSRSYMPASMPPCPQRYFCSWQAAPPVWVETAHRKS